MNEVVKFSELREMIEIMQKSKNEPDIILLQEIWKIADPSVFNLQNYNLICKARTESQGGGVAMYIKKEYRYNILEQNCIFIERVFESLFIEIWLQSNKKKLS